MTGTQDVSRMTIERLAQGCSQETQKFFRRQESNPDYCFELLCRACRDQNETALGQVFTIYIPVLAARARHHPMYPQSCQDATYFAHTALANCYHAVRGEKFLQKFSTLAQTIAYMYSCVHSAVLEDVENHRELVTLLDEAIPSPPPPSNLEQRELLEHIYGLLPDAGDQFLFYLRFVLEMKPAEITRAYPKRWGTPREVSVNLQNIRRRLRADPHLREIGGLTDENQDEDDTEDADN